MIAIPGPLKTKKYDLYDLSNGVFIYEGKDKYIVSLEIDLSVIDYDLLIINNNLDPEYSTSTPLALFINTGLYGKKSFWCNCPGVEANVFIRNAKIIEFDSYGNNYIPKKSYIETYKKHFLYVNYVSPKLAVVIHYLSEEYYNDV